MPKPRQYFRAAAGAIIVNPGRRVLAIERADLAGAWQLPQGGLDEGEDPIDAAYREIQEETGIPRSALTLVQAAEEPLVYELPRQMRNKKTGRGQVLYWFLFQFDGSDSLVNVHHGRESRNWQWMPMNELVDVAVSFRRLMYRRLASEFSQHLAPTTSIR